VSSVKNLTDVCRAFLLLGFTSFGGPLAHLGYFRREFVEKRAWLSDAAYGDLVALCQFLPGPTSSQVAFALGMRRAGLTGALGASVCFMLPSAVAMTLFAYGVSALGSRANPGWLHGLALAAISVVAVALWGMAKSLCPDWPRGLLALSSAAALVFFPHAWVQVAVLVACAGLYVAALGRGLAPPAAAEQGQTGGRTWAGAAIAAFFLLLFGLPVVANLSGSKVAAVFESFYRSGSLVFGGGHVVLPLLRSQVVPRGWVSEGAFVAGYGAAQAIPGPLFTFAAYLGTLIWPASNAWMGGVLALVAIYLPGWLLVGGALPFWGALRQARWAEGAFRGAGAAVVGILLAALYNPLCTEGIRGWGDGACVAAAVALLGIMKIPPWAVVALLAAAGEWLLA
jgi:chromate transporter